MTSPAVPKALTLSLALAFAAPAAFAQATAIDAVIVTATRTPQKASDVISDTVTITAEQIANAGVGSITELLQRQRGIEVVRNGGPGTASNVFIRGASGNQSIVLVDGVRIGSATSGTASWNAIPLSAIDHIEIVYGPLSTLYGADAIGGVIQLFTKKGAGAPAVTVSAGGGTHRTYEAEAGISGGTDRVNYAFSASKERSDGFSATRAGAYGFDPDDDGYDRKNAAGQVSLQLAPGHELGANFLYSDSTAGFDAPKFAAYSTQVVSTIAAYTRNRILPNWTMLAQASQSRDKSGSFSGTGVFDISQIDSKQTQFTWQNDFLVGADTLQLLYEYRKEDVDATTKSLEQSRHTNSVAATYSAKRGNHLFNAGARHDDSSVYGAKNTGSLGYGYRFTPVLRAEASYGTSFRAPTFNELYYPGYGNENNRPERGRNAEAGIHYDDGTTELGAVYYHNKLSDLLVNTTPCPFPNDATHQYLYGCAYNVNKGLLEGLSLTASRTMGALSLAANADFQDAKDETTGKRLPRRAKRHANLTAEYTLGALRTGMEVQLSSSRFDDAANTKRLGGYSLLNLYATYRITPDWSALVRVNNAADRDYELARFYETGGRTVFAGIRYGYK